MAALSVYIHIPFCERKCPYCAFTSYVTAVREKKEYLRALDKEFAGWQKRLGGISAKTVYIGGGTPSCLSLQNWQELADIIEKYVDFSGCSEFTVEANPNSLTRELLKFWKHWRVSRVSIGVQSLDDGELKFLGRLHGSAQALAAVEMAKEFDFDVSADFMFGLSMQTLDGWKNMLKRVVSLEISHLSLYQLSVEEGTPFEKENLILPEGYDEYVFAQKYLAEKGFMQYEIANFARQGKESRHNLNYWRGGEYLGVGASAAGYVGGVRYTNEGNLQKYCAETAAGRSAVAFSEKLEPEAKAREASVLRLRMAEGIDRRKFRFEFGLGCEQYVLDRLKQFPRDLYDVTDEKISLTKKGMCVANRIWAELV